MPNKFDWPSQILWEKKSKARAALDSSDTSRSS